MAELLNPVATAPKRRARARQNSNDSVGSTDTTIAPGFVPNPKLAAIIAAQGEAGPVYLIDSDIPSDTITVDGIDIKAAKGTFGWYLTVNLKDVGLRNITVRSDDKDLVLKTGSRLRIDAFKANREFKPTNSTKTIKFGDMKPFARTI